MSKFAKPIDRVLARTKECLFLVQPGYGAGYCCSMVGIKLPGTNDQFYYQYTGSKACSSGDMRTCPLLRGTGARRD